MDSDVRSGTVERSAARDHVAVMDRWRDDFSAPSTTAPQRGSNHLEPSTYFIPVLPGFPCPVTSQGAPAMFHTTVSGARQDSGGKTAAAACHVFGTAAVRATLVFEEPGRSREMGIPRHPKGVAICQSSCVNDPLRVDGSGHSRPTRPRRTRATAADVRASPRPNPASPSFPRRCGGGREP